ncbi:1707_t:CDS:2, partial [Gigaspora margarita]
MSSPNVLSKASKSNLRKKDLHATKKAKIERPDSSIINGEVNSNIIVNQADKRENIFYNPLKHKTQSETRQSKSKSREYILSYWKSEDFMVKCAHQQQVKAGKVSLEQTTISEALCRNLKDKQIIASVLTDKMSEEDVNIKGYHDIFDSQCFKNTLGETMQNRKFSTLFRNSDSDIDTDISINVKNKKLGYQKIMLCRIGSFSNPQSWVHDPQRLKIQDEAISSEYVEMPQVRTNETPSDGSYAPEIGMAICFFCNQLVYTGKRTKNIGNYNHIGIERHWASHCMGNSYCGVSYNEYLLKIKKKSISGYDYDNDNRLGPTSTLTTNQQDS